jgi:hypothetical protein
MIREMQRKIKSALIFWLFCIKAKEEEIKSRIKIPVKQQIITHIFPPVGRS